MVNGTFASEDFIFTLKAKVIKCTRERVNTITSASANGVGREIGGTVISPDKD
ncbi:hypothetical protein PGT21_006594 [Puccinia graminis f. sp. tritici]|uniref:Uncharacterized protein n=1 Tax=Puccinia graminis f. sp. tritici TaxID=56615 RepID=A0A5B0NBR4_PUCGR|nr:hypothetical protein PGT21_006594 [Puccinia graminis f. sp. tritici]